METNAKKGEDSVESWPKHDDKTFSASKNLHYMYSSSILQQLLNKSNIFFILFITFDIEFFIENWKDVE